MSYNSIYSQLFNFIPRYRFEKIINKSGGDRYCKHFTAWKQFLTLLFAQISAWVQVGYDGADKLYSWYLNAKSISAGSLVAWLKNPWKAAKLEFAGPRGTFQPFTALKFSPDSSECEKLFIYYFLFFWIILVVNNFSIHNKIDCLINCLIWSNEPLSWSMSYSIVIKNIYIQAGISKEIMQ